jgi:hypothetical protein
MPCYVAKRSNFVNSFFHKRSKKIIPHAGSKAADEHLPNQGRPKASLTALDRFSTPARRA